jgi:hypothetical protein
MIMDPELHEILDAAASEPILLECDDRDDIVALSEPLFYQMMSSLELSQDTFAPQFVKRAGKQTIVLLEPSKFIKLENSVWEQIFAISQIGTLMSGLMPDCSGTNIKIPQNLSI